MNPSRVDSIVDLAYGILIALAIVLILVVGEDVGIAFAFGVLVSYVIHVAWKMARYDPEWMTTEVTETVEETISQEVEEVKDEIQDVNERVDRRPRIDELEDEVVAPDASRAEGDQ